ncbi:MAG: tRNA lysidine(34) synthetase TilS [Clostridium sp.]|nr:tRNA lysidine(34) synthetase TilS [Clostridium sp.]
MIREVKETIKKYELIKKGEGLIVGVSGGADSICLLHILHTLKECMQIELTAVHINHMLRAGEALEDERYVERICAVLDIRLEIVRIDIKKSAQKQKISLEEAGREERYKTFNLMADRYGAGRIAVAHNKNDQAETVLMNIIRGSGLNGLQGMEYKRGAVIRPLLGVERSAIEGYCKKHNLNPRIDSSNLESIYTRNRVRLDLIPYIDHLFKTNITNSINKMARLIKDDNFFIEQQIDQIYNEAKLDGDGVGISLDIKVLKKHPIAAAKRIIRNAIGGTKGDLKGIGSKHIESVVELAIAGRTGAVIQLPKGVRAAKSYNILKIYIEGEQEKNPIFNKKIQIPGTVFIDEINKHIDAGIVDGVLDTKNFTETGDGGITQFFDYEKIGGPIYVRHREEGDVFKPLYSIGTKKLKEFFIDNKIPRQTRDSIPLISKGREIVWIIGYKISDKFKVTENTKTVLRLSFGDGRHNLE